MLFKDDSAEQRECEKKHEHLMMYRDLKKYMDITEKTCPRSLVTVFLETFFTNQAEGVNC